jgi:aldehyde dehydrogenase (NAD+)
VLPDGVLNVVSGGDDLGVGDGSPGYRQDRFHGIDTVRAQGHGQRGASLKRVTLELGGNDPAVVLPDIDVPSVAEKLLWGAFGNSGQVCLAAKRLYIHADVYEPPEGPEPPRYGRVLGLIRDARGCGLRVPHRGAELRRFAELLRAAG